MNRKFFSFVVALVTMFGCLGSVQAQTIYTATLAQNTNKVFSGGEVIFDLSEIGDWEKNSTTKVPVLGVTSAHGAGYKLSGKQYIYWNNIPLGYVIKFNSISIDCSVDNGAWAEQKFNVSTSLNANSGSTTFAKGTEVVKNVTLSETALSEIGNEGYVTFEVDGALDRSYFINKITISYELVPNDHFKEYCIATINSAPEGYGNREQFISEINSKISAQEMETVLADFRADVNSCLTSARFTNADVTCLLNNSGFEYVDDWDYGWSGTSYKRNDGNELTMEAYQKQSGNSSFDGNFAQMWRTGGDRTLDAGNCFQTIKLAPGKYKLTANLAQTDIDMWLYESFDNKEVKVGNQSVYEIEFVVNSYTEVTIGVKHNSKKDRNDKWVACDDFKLYYSNDAANLKVAQGKYGTFCAPFEVTIPSGIKAYTVPSLDGAHLNLSEVTTTITANTPVIVEGADNGYDGNFYGPGTDAETCGTGNLVGLLKDVEIPASSYVLQTQSGKQAFYKVESAAYGVVNRCYLKADAKAKVLNFNAEETAIEDLSDFMSGNVQSIYSANGAKVNSLQKGMNIVKMMNGQIKKIMVK